MEGNVLEQIWHWYWVGKAQIGALGVPVLDQVTPVWNWVMSFDIARGAALVVVPLGVLGALYESLLTFDDEATASRPAADDPTSQAAGTNAGSAEPPPAEFTGEELKRELDRLGKTQTELAETLGVTRAYVSQVIRGKKPFTVDLQARCREILASWQK